MASDGFFSGNQVLVTGASTGIGRCVALDYAREGADLIVAARSVEKLETLKGEIESLGRRAIVLPADLSQPGNARALIDRALEEAGSIDILVNNAGIGFSQAVVDLDIPGAREMFEINFWSVVEGTRQVLPHMIRRGSGQIVNVSSIAGKRALPGNSMYNSSKFALQGFSEALRVELYRTGIDVVVICPSVTETPFFEHPNVRRNWDRKGFQKKYAMSPEKVSKILIHASKKKKREVHITLHGWLGVRMNTFFPGLVDRMVDRMMGDRVQERIDRIRKGE